MFGRQTDVGISGERLFESDAYPVLITTGDESGAGCGADGGVGVGLEELDAARGDAIDVWRVEIGASVTRDVGIAKIVGEDEDDVGRLGRRDGASDARSDGGDSSGGGSAEKIASRDAALFGGRHRPSCSITFVVNPRATMARVFGE